MSAHFDHEADMHDTPYSRRVGRIVARTTNAHQQNWRAANDAGDDDALRVARGIWNGLLIGGAMWALLAVCVWALSMLWAG